MTRLAIVMFIVGSVVPLAAQEEGDVRLGITYQPGYVPALVVAPVASRPGLEAIADLAEDILRRDLDFSDRFEIITPSDALPTNGPPNYQLWNQMGAVWLVTADVSGSGASPILRVGLHDVVYGRLENVQAFSLPEMSDGDFRMAIHRASDAVVSWATDGQQGIAATRIAFRRRGSDGTSALYVIDSDGENLQRVSTGGGSVYSPAYSPDGSRIAFTTQDETGTFALVEANLITGGRRTISTSTLIQTPTYTADGRLAYAEMSGGGVEVFLEGAGKLTETRGDALNPTFSPDGRSFAFEADPTNQPQVYVQPVAGGRPRRISVYVRNERTNAVGPDWSPNGDRIAYAAISGRGFQIFTVNPNGTDRRMLTSRGESEAPSWAPDGRHLVFSAADSQGHALWIMDTVTGRSRVLTSGRRDELPDWSPPLPTGS
ncbi:MAG: hypothetical protein MJB57_18075 [Gemmatimonadetes bacterium]|nr:hypothetical protein [Gemmatimonadota bacterium]